MAAMQSIDITIVGGGMITNDLILPTVYHLQRLGMVNEIHICALNNPPLKNLKDNKEFEQAFPGQSFVAHPSLEENPKQDFPELFKQVIAKMPPRQAVFVAMPDQLHYAVIMEALRHDQHVMCVKPLVLKYDQAEEVGALARERGLFVGVEYHKRFDRRALVAKRNYELGHFGVFAMGEAKLVEPYYYRHSNFQNWFTCDKTDPFTYIGCHYVDLVYFITGLKPVEVSLAGVKGKFPNGNEGYLWSSGRVRFENGALLAVTNGLGYPDDAAGSNDQGMLLFCEGKNKNGMIFHDDQFRGVAHSYLEGIGCGGSHYNYINPDFFRYIPWEGEGYKPIGYGADSVSALATTIVRIENQVAGMSDAAALAQRRRIIEDVDKRGLIATPANSYINELVIEAARRSIGQNGQPIKIAYGAHPRIEG